MDIKLEKNESLAVGVGEMAVEEWNQRRIANQEQQNDVLKRRQAYDRQRKEDFREESRQRKAEARSRRLFSENRTKPKWEIS